MPPQLIARHPDHPEGEAFNFDDVYKVAQAVFLGNQFFPFQLQDQWDAPVNDRRNSSDGAMEQWFGYDEDPREYERRRRGYEREPPFFENRSWDGYGRRDGDPPRAAAPSIETNVVHFKDQDRDDEDREIDSLMDKIHGFSPHEHSYATLLRLSTDGEAMSNFFVTHPVLMNVVDSRGDRNLTAYSFLVIVRWWTAWQWTRLIVPWHAWRI
jgi:hypothetical protein